MRLVNFALRSFSFLSPKFFALPLNGLLSLTSSRPAVSCKTLHNQTVFWVFFQAPLRDTDGGTQLVPG